MGQRRRRSGSAPGRAPVVAAVLLAVTLAVLGPVAVAGPADAAASRCTGAAPDGMVRVAVVLDFGTEADSPGGASVECLVVPAGTTGSQLLRHRAELLGRAMPRYADSGLLCALDGYPGGTECPVGSGGAFRYWSYWSGTSGSWVYGTGNPFVRRVRDGDIEGWRFVLARESAAPPPRVAPNGAALFPAAPPPTPAPTPAPSTPGAAPPTTAATPPGRTSGEPAAPGVDAATDVPDGGSAATDEPGESASTTEPPTGEPTLSSAATDVVAPDELAMADDPGGSSVPVATLAGVGLVLGLGAAAAVGFRRRPLG